MTTWTTPAYDGWATLAQAREQDPQFAKMTDAEVTALLQAAYEQCSAFAPAIEVVDGVGEVPASYIKAQIMQAGALRKAPAVGSGDNTGGDFPVTVFPMDWTVKNLLRPATGVPGMW